MKALRTLFAGVAVLVVLPFVAVAFVVALAVATVNALAEEL